MSIARLTTIFGLCAAFTCAQPPQFQFARQFGAAEGVRSDNVAAAASRVGIHAIGGAISGALPGQSPLGARDAYVRVYSDSGALQWTRQFGTSGDDDVTGIAIDSLGNVIVAGITTGTFPGQSNSGGTSDVFILKYNPAGAVVWTRQFGSSAQDFAGKLAVDANGDAVLIGTTRGSLPGFTLSGFSDAFLLRLDAGGSTVWLRQFGSSGDDSGAGVGIDSSGFIYACGSASASLHNQPALGSTDAYVLKLDAGNTLQWTTQFGSTNAESCVALAVDPAGNSYPVVAQSSSSFRKISPAGAILTNIGFGQRIEAIAADANGVAIVGFSSSATLSGQTNAGGNDAYVRRYNTSLVEQWTDLFGTTDSEDAIAVSLTATGVFIAGRTNGVLPGQLPSGNGDAYVRLYTTAGIEQWTNQFGSVGPSENYGFAVHLTASRIHTAGRTSGALPGNAHLGDSDAFLATHDLNGNLLWLRQFGTSGYDSANGVSVDGSGNVITGGDTLGILPGQVKLSAADGFLKKFDAAGGEIWTRQFAWPGASRTTVGAIAANAAGEIFVVGDAVIGGPPGGNIEVVAAKFDPSGNLVWTRLIGTPALEGGNGIALESNGGVVICGQTSGVLGQVLTGNGDAFIARLDAAGNVTWLTQFGVAAGQIAQCNSVAIAPDGSIYGAGQNTGNFPGQSNAGGTFDIFAVKLSSSGAISWLRQFGTNLSDRGVAALPGPAGTLSIAGAAGGSDPIDTLIQRFDSNGNPIGTLLHATPNVDLTIAAAGNADGTIVAAGYTTSAFSGQVQTGIADVFIKKYVLNAPPAVGVTSAAIAANEGTIAVNSGTWSDPNGDAVTLSASPGTIVKNANGTWSWTMTAVEGPAAVPVTVTATDSFGAAATTTFQLTIANLPPILGPAAGPTSAVAIGTNVTISAPVSDPGVLDTITCTFAWNDGTPNTTTTAGPCSASHTYTVPGVYSVLITANDDDGGAATTRFDFVIVFDPSAGFVTGGGWIQSPAGAYLANPALAGRANFGFVARYQPGASVPSGQAEFHFETGKFRFNIESYQWLVVAGARTQLKGTGAVNGATGFGFLLTAVDGKISGGGGVDKFRIKIWRIATATTPETLVYDNVPGAPDDIANANPATLGGGSITIHSK